MVALTAALLLGLALLANPLYFAPENLDGETPKYTYELSPVETEAQAEQALYQSESTLRCGTGADRVCALEREVLENGTLTYQGTILQDEDARHDPFRSQEARYAVVELDHSFYVPTVEGELGGPSEIRLEEVTAMEAVEHAAVPVERTDRKVQEGIEHGSVTSYDRPVPTMERLEPIEHDGQVYAVTGWRFDSTNDGQLVFTRFLLFIVGGVLTYYAWTRALWRAPT